MDNTVWGNWPDAKSSLARSRQIDQKEKAAFVSKSEIVISTGLISNGSTTIRLSPRHIQLIPCSWSVENGATCTPGSKPSTKERSFRQKEMTLGGSPWAH